MSLIRLLAQFMRLHWRQYLAAFGMLLAIAVLTVWIPRQIGYVIDRLAEGKLDSVSVLFELGKLIVFGVAIYFLRVGWRLQLFSASYELGVNLRMRLYDCLAVQSPAFFQQQRTGDLMALGTNDADTIEMAAGEAVLAGFDGTLTFLMVIGMMIVGVDWRLALAALLPFPLMGLAFKHVTHHVHEASRDALNRFSSLNDHVQETLAGVRTVRALGLEPRSAAQFAQRAGLAADASLAAQRWEAAYEPAVGMALTAAGALTLGVGGYLVWQGELTVGALTSFSMYLGQLIWPMFAAGWVLALLERGKAAWGRLQPVLLHPVIVEDRGELDVSPRGELDLRALSFRYPQQSRWALQGIDLQLQPGQTLGLVGPTGAGKSSVLRLLLRQYPQGQGSIVWGGHALDRYRLQALRGAVSWVAQEPFLFSDSIANNIALGKPDATMAEIENAAKLAAIHDDILHFPEGYRTLVGERGVTLSGGQRQRVAIARALLADSALLLLDDALSAVDTGTETRILQHLSALRSRQRDRITIIVSHRLSAVAQADRILVLDHGHIVEQGSHDALLAHGGWYAAQWRYQQLEATLDAA